MRHMSSCYAIMHEPNQALLGVEACVISCPLLTRIRMHPTQHQGISLNAAQGCNIAPQCQGRGGCKKQLSCLSHVSILYAPVPLHSMLQGCFGPKTSACENFGTLTHHNLEEGCTVSIVFVAVQRPHQVITCVKHQAGVPKPPAGSQRPKCHLLRYGRFRQQQARVPQIAAECPLQILSDGPCI